MNITYREAKRILAKQEEARDVINSYRGMETLGKRLQLKNNKELILKLFEIEEDTSIIEIFTHLKALYEEQWGDAEATAQPAGRRKGGTVQAAAGRRQPAATPGTADAPATR